MPLTSLLLASSLLYTDVKPVLDGTCVPCHNPRGQAGFLPLTALAEVKGNEAYMISAIETDYMPMDAAPGFKTSEGGKRLLEWLKGGTDLGHPPSAPPHILMKDPRELRYADVKPIIDRHCTGCHAPGGRMARKPLTTLDGIKRHVRDAWEQVDKGLMPQGNAEFRFTADGRALMGWLRYAPDAGGPRSGAPTPGGDDDDGVAPGDDD